MNMNTTERTAGANAVAMERIGGQLAALSERNNREIVEILRSLIPESKSETVYVEDRLGHDLRYSMDPTEYQLRYGDLKQLSLEAGLQDTITWYRNRKELW
jgi:dTDP-glucose 4,6-dehydratase